MLVDVGVVLPVVAKSRPPRIWPAESLTTYAAPAPGRGPAPSLTRGAAPPPAPTGAGWAAAEPSNGSRPGAVNSADDARPGQTVAKDAEGLHAAIVDHMETATVDLTESMEEMLRLQEADITAPDAEAEAPSPDGQTPSRDAETPAGAAAKPTAVSKRDAAAVPAPAAAWNSRRCCFFLAAALDFLGGTNGLLIASRTR